MLWPFPSAVVGPWRWAKGCQQTHSSDRRRRVPPHLLLAPSAKSPSCASSFLPTVPRAISPALQAIWSRVAALPPPDQYVIASEQWMQWVARLLQCGSPLSLPGQVGAAERHRYISDTLFSGVAAAGRHGWHWSRATPQPGES